MSIFREARLAHLLLLVCSLSFCTGLENAKADAAGLKYKLPTSVQPANVLVRPSDTTIVDGTSPHSSLPQLATCGCPAAEQEGKAPGSSVVTAMQNITAATTWTVDQTIFLSDQDMFHTEVRHQRIHKFCFSLCCTCFWDQVLPLVLPARDPRLRE